MRHTKKLLSLLLALVMVISIFTACGSSEQKPEEPAEPTENETENPAAPEEAGEEKLEQVTLKILMAGDSVPADQEMVWDAIAEKTKDSINVKLDVTYIPWVDYQSKVQTMIGGGDSVDMFLSFSDVNTLGANKSVANGLAMPLTDLIDQYGPAIKAAIPENEWIPYTVDGQITGVPACYLKDGIYATVIRKDLREKYGMDEIHTQEQYEAYMQAVVDNEPNIVPIGTGGLFEHDAMIHLDDVVPNGYGPVEWQKDENGKLVASSRYDVGDAEYVYAQVHTDWYAKGYQEKDCLSQKDPVTLFESGKCAALEVDIYNFTTIEQKLKAAVPEAELEWVILEDRLVKWTQSNNLCQIASTSENPERAMMFLNWLYEDQANYDLYMFGIEGVHYTLDGDAVVLPEGVDMTNNPYAPTPWAFYNLKFHRPMSIDSELYQSFYKYLSTETSIAPDADEEGFTFNAEPVTMELAQCERIMDEIWLPMRYGVVPLTDENYADFVKQMDAAGFQTVLEEAQKQIDTYMNSK